MPTIYQIIIVTLLTTFSILVMSISNLRYALRDKCDSQKIKILAKLLDCDFCFGFWTAVAVAIVFSVITQQLSWLITPFLSAPLVRILL